MNLMSAIPTPAWFAGLKVVTAKCEFCHRQTPLRQISARKVGIRMGEFWYCSSSCFTSAAEQKLTELLTTRRVNQGSRGERMPLGLSLMSRGLVTQTQFKQAADEQKEVGGEIGELLVRHGSVSEEQVTAVRATQWGCPVFDVQKYVVRTRIQIPAVLTRVYSAIPLHFVEATKLLLVGFVHGIDYGLLYAIEQVTGFKTQPCFVTPSDFQTQLQEMEQSQQKSENSSHREVKFEDVRTPAEIARILCEYGVDLEADEAAIGKCKDLLWARLNCGTKEIDLLFNAG